MPVCPLIKIDDPERHFVSNLSARPIAILLGAGDSRGFPKDLANQKHPSYASSNNLSAVCVCQMPRTQCPQYEHTHLVSLWTPFPSTVSSSQTRLHRSKCCGVSSAFRCWRLSTPRTVPFAGFHRQWPFTLVAVSRLSCSSSPSREDCLDFTSRCLFCYVRYVPTLSSVGRISREDVTIPSLPPPPKTPPAGNRASRGACQTTGINKRWSSPCEAVVQRARWEGSLSHRLTVRFPIIPRRQQSQTHLPAPDSQHKVNKARFRRFSFSYPWHLVLQDTINYPTLFEEALDSACGLRLAHHHMRCRKKICRTASFAGDISRASYPSQLFDSFRIWLIVCAYHHESSDDQWYGTKVLLLWTLSPFPSQDARLTGPSLCPSPGLGRGKRGKLTIGEHLPPPQTAIIELAQFTEGPFWFCFLQGGKLSETPGLVAPAFCKARAQRFQNPWPK